MKKIVLLFVVLLTAFTLSAQNPYNHSVGIVLGTNNGFSYKGFFGSNFAIQADLTWNWLWYHNNNYAYLSINPNFMYEANIVKGLHWFVGGGLSLCSNFNHMGKFGINAIGGLEYAFNVPITLQLDIRPGFGVWLGEYYNSRSFVDYGGCFSVRYTF